MRIAKGLEENAAKDFVEMKYILMKSRALNASVITDAR